MGFSATLLKKEFLEFSLEIDRDISLEMSTGFGPPNRVTTHANMPLTVDELGGIIEQLKDLHAKLLKAWKCENCGALNQEDETECGTCDQKRKP